jgi:hypothetical protein
MTMKGITQEILGQTSQDAFGRYGTEHEGEKKMILYYCTVATLITSSKYVFRYTGPCASCRAERWP